MTAEQIDIIEKSISFYHSHCVKMAVMQRGVNRPKPGENMTASYKRKIENAEVKREELSKRSAEVLDTLYQFDKESEKLMS